MYQVLLVDDEALVRGDLRLLIDWEKHGFQLCGEAYNGMMAMSMIEQTQPHIAIIDVNMPELNGVELNRMLRERFPAIRTIILSSYDDYDYVRECLKNGAVDYLLKHRLNGEGLLAVLNKAVLELEQEQQGRLHDHLGMSKPSPALVRDALTDLVRGKPDAAKELEKHVRDSGLYPGAVCYTAAAVQIVPFLLLTESYSDVQTNRLMQQAVDIMQQSVGDLYEHTVAYLEDGRLLVVFACKERSEHVVVSEAGRLMSKLQHALELFLNLKCIYSVGHVCGSLAQLAASYASAERALSIPSPHIPGQRVSLTIEEQKQLLFSIERMDSEGTQQLIASVFASVRQQSVYSHPVQMIVSELLHTGNKALEKWMSAHAAEKAEAELPSRSELGRIGTIGELEQWLQSYYTGLLQLLKRQRVVGPHSRHVSQAIQLILEKYSGYVTLELAAGDIGLNPSYLSRIFKEETRSTFSEYLNRVRIDAACRLLESGQYSIKQISNQVGFPNYSYFFKVFKEMTGATPQSYYAGLSGKAAGAETVR